MRDVVHHSAEPPVCGFCDQKFPLNALLLAHTEQVHGQDGLKRLAQDGIILKDDYDFSEYTATGKYTKCYCHFLYISTNCIILYQEYVGVHVS